MMQVALVAGMGQAAMPDRMVRLSGYFTIQASLLVLVWSVSFVIGPTWDGWVLQVIRLDALVAALVTFPVHLVVLRPVRHFNGWDAVVDAGLHYLSPLLVIGGWLLLGPGCRVDFRVGSLAMIWPVAWYVWTLLYGAASGFYPYPFVDVRIHGYEGVLLRAAMVAGMLIFGGIVVRFLDRRPTTVPPRGWSLLWRHVDDVVRPSS